MIETSLLSILLSDINNVDYYNYVVRDFRRYFSKDMPKRYLIFPTQPKIYTVSHTVCIEMPSWGSLAYRNKLNLVEKVLDDAFKLDVIFFDGKITYCVKEEEDEEDRGTF